MLPSIPCENLEGPRACWKSGAVSAFDCAAYSGPLQAVRKKLNATAYEAFYTVLELDIATGVSSDLYTLDAGAVVATAMLDAGDDGYFAFAAMDGFLCRFDAASSVCFSEAISANVGAIIGNTYYYAATETDFSFYFVLDVHTDAPVFVRSAKFEVATSLCGAVSALAPLEEGSDLLVDDGFETGQYLVGFSAVVLN